MPGDIPNADLGTRAWWRLIVTEPFFHFIVLGLLVWVGVTYLQVRNDRYSVVVGPADSKRLAESYFQQFRQAPTAEQLRTLVDRSIRDEIYVREALALKLDRDDEIVRRRLIQKYEFLQVDLAVPETPSPDLLAQWFEANKERYVTPDMVSFTHVYFSTDTSGEEAARLRAAKVLETLQHAKGERQPGLGDSFPGPADVAAMAPKDAVRLFGDSEIAKSLFQAPLNQWVGPFRSGFGWHLVYLTEHLPAKHPSLDDVRDWVRSDWIEDQRRQLRDRTFEKLRAKYTVRYEGEGQ